MPRTNRALEKLNRLPLVLVGKLKHTGSRGLRFYAHGIQLWVPVLYAESLVHSRAPWVPRPFTERFGVVAGHNRKFIVKLWESEEIALAEVAPLFQTDFPAIPENYYALG